MRSIAALCLSLVALSAHAGGATNVITSTGTATCVQFTSSVSGPGGDQKRIEALRWVEGFMSATNMLRSGGGMPMITIPNVMGLSSWLDGYCSAHPNDHLWNAASTLVVAEQQQQD